MINTRLKVFNHEPNSWQHLNQLREKVMESKIMLNLVCWTRGQRRLAGIHSQIYLFFPFSFYSLYFGGWVIKSLFFFVFVLFFRVFFFDLGLISWGLQIQIIQKHALHQHYTYKRGPISLENSSNSPMHFSFII